MMRSAVKAAAQRSGWEEAKIDSFVLGHGESKVSAAHVAVGPRRFAYLPLPSIESRKDRTGGVAGSVRSVIVTTFSSDCQDAVAWAKRAVSGVELRDDDTKEAVALLSLIPDRDNGVQRYLQQAATWATVTPMVLPGFDDPAHYRRRMKKPIGAEGQRILLERLDTRIDGLLRKAIVQAGFSQELADNALVEWRKVGFWPGSEPAERYGTPAHLKRFPTYHVKIRWRDAQLHAVEIPGPICLGGGRFYGLGLFAAM